MAENQNESDKEIYWCSINATNKILADKMEARGYQLKHVGNSCFESRNIYVIKTEDEILTPEVFEKMQQDLEECKLEATEDKLKAFDQYFDEQSVDKNKVYSLVKTGYNYDQTRIQNSDKYETVAEDIIAYTGDGRTGYRHTYQSLVFHVDRIINDKRNFITIEVPQNMIGMLVGKGGRNIKKLEERFGKRFRVVQSAKEKEEQKIQKHKEDLQQLRSDVIDTVGDFVLTANEQDLQKAVVDYMEVNKHSLPFIPSVEELKGIYERLCEVKELRVAEEAERRQMALESLQIDIEYSFGKDIVSFSDADVAQKTIDYLNENKDKLPVKPNMEELKIMQQNLLTERDERIVEQKQRKKSAKEKMYRAADKIIHNFVYENDRAMPSDEVLKAGIADFLEHNSDDSDLAKVADNTEKEIILLLQKERHKEQVAEKNFNDTATKVLEKFFHGNESRGHGKKFFSIMGENKQAAAYDQLANRMMEKLGLSAEEDYPLPTIKSIQYDKCRIGIEDFEKRYSGTWSYDEYSLPETKKEQPAEAKEPTLANLAALWGAKLKTPKR
mgnify:CR=1 FL=1